jgi:hypothetical protein
MHSHEGVCHDAYRPTRPYLNKALSRTSCLHEMSIKHIGAISQVAREVARKQTVVSHHRIYEHRRTTTGWVRDCYWVFSKVSWKLRALMFPEASQKNTEKDEAL